MQRAKEHQLQNKNIMTREYISWPNLYILWECGWNQKMKREMLTRNCFKTDFLQHRDTFKFDKIDFCPSRSGIIERKCL